MEKANIIIPPLVYELFKNSGMTSEWFIAICRGDTYIFGDTIVNVTSAADVVFVNSASLSDRFSLPALRFIGQLIRQNENIYIQTTDDKVIRHLIDRYGFKYDEVIKAAYKLSWDND